MTAKIVSRHASILVFVLIMAVPEVNYALLIPTHDIPGAFYAVFYVFILFWAWRAIKSGFLDKNSPRTYLIIALIVLSLFLIALLLDVQRNIYLPLAFSFLLFSCYRYFSQGKRKFLTRSTALVLVLLVAPLVLEIGAVKVLEKEGVLATDSFGWKYKGPSIMFPHTFSEGTFRSAISFKKKYLTDIGDKKVLKKLRKSLILSDIYYNIQERPSNYLMRSQVLYSLGAQGAYYYGKLQGLTQLEARSISNLKNGYNTVFVASFVVLLLAAVFCILFGRNRFFDKTLILPLIVMSILTLALLLIGENQPRYLFIGWFLWSVVVAWFVNSFFTKRADSHQVSGFNSFQNATFGSRRAVAVALIVAMLSYIIFCSWFYFSDARFIDMRAWSSPVCSDNIAENDCQRSVMSFEPGLADKAYSTLQLQLPTLPRIDDFARVERLFHVSKGVPQELSFFVKSPYKRDDERTGYFDINVYINGDIVRTLHLEDTSQYRFVRTRNLISENGKLHVGLEIRSNIGYASPSWQRASEVHFKFMSLYHVKESNNTQKE